MMEPKRADETEIQLHLLDAALGHPVQTWRFSGQQMVCIGRSEECDVTTADVRVSRRHAELRLVDGAWTVVSLGRNGVFLDGKLVAESPLADKAVMQFGSGGPSFQFSKVDHSRAERENCETVQNVDPSALEFLDFDQQQKDEDVRRIIEDDSFRLIQEQSRKLRQQRDDDSEAD